MRFILSLAIFLTGFAQGAVAEDMQQRRIVLSGQGEVTTVPDMAVITLGAVHRAETAREAVDQVSKNVAAILSRMADLGIETRDMQTTQLSLFPLRDDSYLKTSGSPEIEGFQASNSVFVRVRALDQLGHVLDSILDEGANNFSGFRFAVQETGPLEDAAKIAAIKDARRKATLYAEAAGVTVGKILEISEDGGYRAAPTMEMAAMTTSRSRSVPVAAGELQFTANVRVVFELTD